jgi:hypothetical protein
MLDHLSGATRLFPIIGDPIKYVESPVHLTQELRRTRTQRRVRTDAGPGTCPR